MSPPPQAPRAASPQCPLPPLVVLTDSRGTGGRPLLEVVQRSVEGGARAVLLREKHLPRHERARLARALHPILEAAGGLLLVASDPAVPGDGVHLAAADPRPQRAPRLLGRSCHSRDDTARAAAEGCAYALLSPIFISASKPGYGPALTPAALSGLDLPVWALGGIDAANAPACLAAGAAGVAVMGAVMRAADPAAATAALLGALSASARRTPGTALAGGPVSSATPWPAAHRNAPGRRGRG